MEPSRRRRTTARALLTFGVFAVVMGLLYAAVVVLPPLLAPDLRIDDPNGFLPGFAALETDRIQAQNSARAGLLQALAGLALGLGALGTWWTVRVNREGQVTERYTRAVDQLGHEDSSVRTGGVYALERIAGDSERDRKTIVDVLSAFLRRNASRLQDDEHNDFLGSGKPDVQAGIMALSRIARPGEINLPRVNLARADLKATDLSGARLGGANLMAADLRNAMLKGALLNHADLSSARLNGADLRDAQLIGAKLDGAHLTGTKLTGADLQGAAIPDGFGPAR